MSQAFLQAGFKSSNQIFYVCFPCTGFFFSLLSSENTFDTIRKAKESVKNHHYLLRQPNTSAHSSKYHETHFPRAKHSNFTVEPLATGRVSGN